MSTISLYWTFAFSPFGDTTVWCTVGVLSSRASSGTPLQSGRGRFQINQLPSFLQQTWDWSRDGSRVRRQCVAGVVKRSLLNTIKGLGSLQSAGLVFVVSSGSAGAEVLRLMMIYCARRTIRVNRSKLILSNAFSTRTVQIILSVESYYAQNLLA